MPSSLKVAVGQVECVPGDLQANLRGHLRMIEQAREAEAGLLLFPELSLTDYLPAPDCPAQGLRHDDTVFGMLARAAGAMTLSVGFIERGEDGRYYNAQALVANGGVRAVHRKLNLPGYGNLREDRVYAKGEQLGIQAVAGDWRAATLICADHWNPALAWLAALGGASLMLVPAASALGAVGDGFDNPRGWEINLAHTALTYGLPTVFANHCGTRGNIEFWGGSRILNADGRELARAGAEPQLIVADIRQADGEAARRRLPTVRDADPELVRRLLAQRLATAGQS